MIRPAGSGEIRALTSLRGIAAMAVVLQHFSTTAQQHSASNIPSLVPHGYIAVDLFFVLSGFIMAYTYLRDFEARGLAAFVPFLLKRVARIVPLNSFAVCLVLAMGAVSGVVLGRNVVFDSAHVGFDAVCNLLMLQGVGIGTNLNAPSWSISTEFAAYLVFPVLIGIVFHRRWWLAGGAVLACAILLTGLATMQPRLGLNADSIVGGLIRCFTEFAIGLMTYRIVQLPSARAVLEGDGVALAAIGWTLAMLLARVDLLIVCGFPPLIGALACNRGRVAAWFGLRFPYFLGVISFSIYLLHHPLRPVWLEVIRALHPEPMSTPLALAVAFGCSVSVIPLARLAYVAIERPGRRMLRRTPRTVVA